MPSLQQYNEQLLRFNEAIDQEYDSVQERARLSPYGMAAEAPPPPTPPLTRAQKAAMHESALDILVKLAQAEDDLAKAMQPDFKNTLAHAALKFYTDMASAQMQANSPSASAKVRQWGTLAGKSLDTMTAVEQRQLQKISKDAWDPINGMINTLAEIPKDELDAVTLDSAFGEEFKNLIIGVPDEAGARLSRLSSATNIPASQLIDLAKRSQGGMEIPALESALRGINEQDAQDIFDYQKAQGRLQRAAQNIDSQGVGAGSHAQRGEALLMNLLVGSGAFGGKVDPDAAAQAMGLMEGVPESPSATHARTILKEYLDFAESEWGRRTIPDWVIAVKEDPAFDDYMRSKGMVDAQDNPLRHRKDEAYKMMRKEWKRGLLQEPAPPPPTREVREETAPRGEGRGRVGRHLRDQFSKLFGADQESREQRLESLKERRDDPRERKLWVTSEGEPTYAPPVAADARIRRLERLTGSEDAGDVASPAGEAPLPEEEDRPFFGTEKHVLDGGEAAAPEPRATLPPGAISTGTEGWANYAKYPDGTIRFVHPKTGKLVTVTEASDPTSYNAITEKAFGQPGTATSPGQEGAISAQTPAGPPIDEYGFPMQSDAMTGESAAPAETGGLPGFGSIQTPPPSAQRTSPINFPGAFGSEPSLRMPNLGPRVSPQKRGDWLLAKQDQLRKHSAGFPLPPVAGDPLFEEWQAFVQGGEAVGEFEQSQQPEELVRPAVSEQTAEELGYPAESRIDIPPETDAIAPEGYQDLPAEADEPREDLTSPRPHTQTQGYDTLTPLDSTPYDATQPLDPTEDTLQAEGQVWGQGPQVRLDEEEAMAAKGGELGSRMDPTEGGMRDFDADADFEQAMREIEAEMPAEEAAAAGPPSPEGGEAVSKEDEEEDKKDAEAEEEVRAEQPREEIPAEAGPQREEPPGATPYRDTSIEPIADPGRTQVQPVTNFEAQAHGITPAAAVATPPGMSQASVDPSIGMGSEGARATKKIQALLNSTKKKEEHAPGTL